MRKIFLIAQREYLVRVRKRTFLLATILTPLFFAAIMILPVWLSSTVENEKKIAVIDDNGLFINKLRDKPKITFVYPQVNIQTLKNNLPQEGYYALLYIPKLDIDEVKEVNNIKIFSEKSISVDVELALRDAVKQAIEEQKLSRIGIKPQDLEKAKISIKMNTETLKGEDSSSIVASAIALIGAFIVYFAVFLYGSQVLQGVIEEKSNRIIEVIISSVKPFELMMGKILGIAAIGLTQFLLWIILTFSITTATFSILKIDNTKATTQQLEAINKERKEAIAKETQTSDNKMLAALFNMNLSLILGVFLFYFLFGYLIYSALFAAVGSAIDNVTDAQQFTFPITTPMIAAIVVVQPVLREPDGILALIFSLFPLTSPVTMMVRLPFGVPTWQLILSMLLLLVGFVFCTWLAARIYRVGVLMYGKKPTYKELGKWLFMKI